MTGVVNVGDFVISVGSEPFRSASMRSVPFRSVLFVPFPFSLSSCQLMIDVLNVGNFVISGRKKAVPFRSVLLVRFFHFCLPVRHGQNRRLQRGRFWVPVGSEPFRYVRSVSLISMLHLPVLVSQYRRRRSGRLRHLRRKCAVPFRSLSSVSLALYFFIILRFPVLDGHERRCQRGRLRHFRSEESRSVPFRCLPLPYRCLPLPFRPVPLRFRRFRSILLARFFPSLSSCPDFSRP